MIFMQSDKRNKKHSWAFDENILFLSLISLIIIFGMIGFVRTQKTKSDLENRMLTKFGHFSIDGFMSGSFQDNFENAISDQFPKSETIRVGYGQIINNLPSFGLDKLICMNMYMDAPSSTKYRSRFFDCGDYMLPYPIVMDKDKAALYQKHVDNYNRINEMADVYYYFVLDANVRDFEKGEATIDIEGMLSEDLNNNKGLEFFKVDSYEQHKKYFYKTDHHWNYLGSYEGYLDIAKMLGVKNAVDRPAVLTNHDIFMGSSANAILYFDIKEEFNFYDFEFPKHDTYINGKKSEYGHLQDYKNHNYSENVTSYYSYVYGGNEGEVIFDYHNPEAENLLIISNSFGNPIKSLIAQHFNKTYAVDLRGYKNEMGKDFVMKDYIKEHKIDKVLFVMTYSFLFGEEQNQGLEL